jgi:hypothetical protein
MNDWQPLPIASIKLGMSRQKLWRKIDYYRHSANQVAFPTYGEHWRYDPIANKYYVNLSADRIQEAFA